MRRTQDPDWFDFLRVGDVLQRGKDGPYRVVRHVSRWERIGRGKVERDRGPLRYVAFTIRHPSWTGRCHTHLAAADLKTQGYRYIGVRLPLTSELDAKIDAALKQPCGEPYVLTAKDVRGVA